MTQPGSFPIARPARIFAAFLLAILVLALPTLALAGGDSVGVTATGHSRVSCGVYSISGVVFDADTYGGIPGARLLLFDQSLERKPALTRATNTQGEYRFVDVPAGAYVLVEINNPAWPYDASANRITLDLPCVPGINGVITDNNFADRR
jgi:hypothetical protein